MDAKGTPILLINIYQCCSQPTNMTGNSAYCQQQILLSQQGRANTNPRPNFYQDIHTLIAKYLQEHPEGQLIIMGDWNETCQGNSTSNKLCRDYNLVDLWNFHNPDEEFRTYQRGQHHIDFTLVSTTLATRMNLVYEPFQYRMKGDHRAMILQFQGDEVFGSNLAATTPRKS